MRFLILGAILLSVSNYASQAARSGYRRTVSYEGEILVRCHTETPAVQSLLKSDFVDIWGRSPNGGLDIRVERNLFASARVEKECIVVGDVEDIVQRAEKAMFEAQQDGWFEAYHGYEEIVEWYSELARNHTDIVRFVPSIGQSFEGRDQPAVHLKGANGELPIVYFQCQIHAREWISGATCMYIANYLAENYAVDERVRAVLNLVEIVIVPFVNPDGYEYSRSNDRLWRKNRQTDTGSSCLGVDLNRNYDDHWNEGGSSGNPCSETYHGRGPESEPETQNTARYFRSLGNIVGAIDWHSYSQLILRPYGWTREDSPDEAKLKALGDKMRDLIYEVHQKSYTSQKSIGLYPTSGTADDWFYSDNANFNNRYRAAGYTIELRPASSNPGFQLPPNEIIPQGEEMIPAVIEFALELGNRPIER